MRKYLPDEDFCKPPPTDKTFTKQVEKCVFISEVSKALGLYKELLPLN